MLTQVFIAAIFLRAGGPDECYQIDYGKAGTARDGLQVTRVPSLDQPAGLRLHLLGIEPKGNRYLIIFVNNSCSLVMNMINIPKLFVAPKRRWGNGSL